MSKTNDEALRKKRLMLMGIGAVALLIILTILIAHFRASSLKRKPVESVKTVTNSTTLAQESWIAKSSAAIEKITKNQQNIESQLKQLQQESKQQAQQPNMNTNTLGLIPNSSNSTKNMVNYPPPPPAPNTPPPAYQSSASACSQNEPNCAAVAKPQPSTRQEENLIGIVTPENNTELQQTKPESSLPTPKQAPASTNNTSTGNSKVSPMGFEIPPGSFVKAYLLTGADVPTSGNGEVGPIPVVFRVISDAQMPNLYKSDIKSCFMLGQATGSLAAERAYIRIDTLSCITKSGKDIVRSMQGYATGSDGKVGLAGVVVSKQGSMLARALVAGFLQGVGQAFQQSETNLSVSPLGSTTSVAPNSTTLLRYGIGGGVGQATTKLAEFYMKMANQMFPVVVINAGRTANIIFLKSVKL